MPVPWRSADDTCTPCFTRIHDATDRAMTVKQLRALRLFIERLCKTRLLRHSRDSPFGLYKKGDLIKWSEINLYDITDEIFQPLIPFLLRRTDHPSPEHGCSWTELVASDLQQPTVLFSHCWAGRFRDLMCVRPGLACRGQEPERRHSNLHLHDG